MVPPAAQTEDQQVLFRAGDSVQIKGIYRVVHYAHRLPHETAILVLKKSPDATSAAMRFGTNSSAALESCSRTTTFVQIRIRRMRLSEPGYLQIRHNTGRA